MEKCFSINYKKVFFICLLITQVLVSQINQWQYVGPKTINQQVKGYFARPLNSFATEVDRLFKLQLDLIMLASLLVMGLHREILHMQSIMLMKMDINTRLSFI